MDTTSLFLQTIGLALLVWRFITYYSFILLGAALSIFYKLRKNGRKPSPAAETSNQH